MQTDLLNIFFEESEEHLQSLNENVLTLEQNPTDMDVVGEIFRSAHVSEYGIYGNGGFNA